MRWMIEQDGSRREVEVRGTGEGPWQVSIDGGDFVTLEVHPAGLGQWVVNSGSHRTVFGAAVDVNQVFLQKDGWDIRFSVEDGRKKGFDFSDTEGAGQIQTQMPGVVVRVLVKAGDCVVKGQAVAVVEAMKMENEFKAPKDGLVSEVFVVDGETVATGQVLLTISEDGDES